MSNVGSAATLRQPANDEKEGAATAPSKSHHGIYNGSDRPLRGRQSGADPHVRGALPELSVDRFEQNRLNVDPAGFQSKLQPSMPRVDTPTDICPRRPLMR
jgi:hypothetical protein